MKICVDIGHNSTNDKGSSVVENLIVSKIGGILVNKLNATGHRVLVVTPYQCSDEEDSLMQRVVAANNFGADLLISLHADDGQGFREGADAFTISEIGKAISKNILENLSAGETAYMNNGVKDGRGVFVLEKASMPSILLNCFYSDSLNDTELYEGSYGAEFIADAITRGINGYLGI